MPPSKSIFLCLFLVYASFKSVVCISCYQCTGSDSNDPFECNEYLDSDTELVPTNCSSIHNAQFCIKHVGRFEDEDQQCSGGILDSTRARTRYYDDSNRVVDTASIECYQCNSSTTMECGDGLMKLDGGVLSPMSCEHVHNARYCIKQIGGISTKRSCSSLDLGNYCSYVQQPGDKLEYRTCIYTCSTDGCNAADTLRISVGVVLGILMFVFTL